MNFTKTTLLGTAFAFSMVAGVAHAEYLVGYEFKDQPGDQEYQAPAATADHIVGGNVVRGAALNAAAGYHSICANGWVDAVVLDDDQYLAFSFTVAAGYEAACSEFVFGMKASSSGPDNFAWYISSDASVTSILLGTATEADLNSSGYYNAKMDLSAFTFGSTNEATTVEIRMFGTDADAANGSLRWGNYYPGYEMLGVTGSVAAVPEPASLALLGLGGLAMLRRRK